MDNQIKVFTRVEMTEEGKGKLSKVIEYSSGNQVVIPINNDGSIKWFDDSKLLKKS